MPNLTTARLALLPALCGLQAPTAKRAKNVQPLPAGEEGKGRGRGSLQAMLSYHASTDSKLVTSRALSAPPFAKVLMSKAAGPDL